MAVPCMNSMQCCMACETWPFQYCNHVSDFSVQCANGTTGALKHLYEKHFKRVTASPYACKVPYKYHFSTKYC